MKPCIRANLYIIQMPDFWYLFNDELKIKCKLNFFGQKSPERLYCEKIWIRSWKKIDPERKQTFFPFYNEQFSNKLKLVRSIWKSQINICIYIGPSKCQIIYVKLMENRMQYHISLFTIYLSINQIYLHLYASVCVLKNSSHQRQIRFIWFHLWFNWCFRTFDISLFTMLITMWYKYRNIIYMENSA